MVWNIPGTHHILNICAERMSLTISSLLHYTMVLNSTGENHTDRQTCMNTDSLPPTGRPAPQLAKAPGSVSRSPISLAQSAALPFPSLSRPLSVAYHEKQTNKTEFLWGIPINIKPAHIELSYMYVWLSSSFSGMNLFPYWKLKNISIFILDLVFPPFWKTQFHKSLLFLLYFQLPTIISNFSWPNTFR